MAQGTMYKSGYTLRTVMGAEDNAAVARELTDSIKRIWGADAAELFTETIIEHANTKEIAYYVMGYLVGTLNTECRMQDVLDLG